MRRHGGSAGNVSCTVANYTICQNLNALTYLWVQLTKVVLYNGHKEVVIVNVQFFFQAAASGHGTLIQCLWHRLTSFML